MPVKIAAFTDSGVNATQSTLVKICGWEVVEPAGRSAYQVFFDYFNASTS